MPPPRLPTILTSVTPSSLRAHGAHPLPAQVHVWNYPGGETAETPPSDAAPASSGAQQTPPQASSSGGGGQRAQIEAQIAALNQQMEQLAASRKYAEV